MNNPGWYSLFNPLIWIICFLVSYRNYVLYPHCGNVYRKDKKEVISLLFFFFLLTTLFTLRGGDDLRYREFVEETSYYYGLREFYSFEYYYYFIAELVNHNFYLWKIVVYLPALLITYISIKRLNANNFSTYMAFSIFCLASFGAARGVLAFSLFLFGYTFITDYKWYKWLLGFFLIICSIFTHRSMAIPIALTFLVFFRLTKARIGLLIALFPVMVMAFNYIYPMLFLDVSADDMTGQVGHKFETYTDEDSIAGAHYFSSFLSEVHGIYGVIAIFIMLVYAVKADIKDKLPKHISRLVRVSFYTFYLALVILCSKMNGRLPISMRYFTMIPFFIFVLWPYILSDNSVMSYKKHSVFILVCAGYLAIKFFLISYYGLSQ